MKKDLECEVSDRAAEKFVTAVKKHATKSVARFHEDIQMADAMGGLAAIEELLKRADLWDTVVDTYQQRRNRSFVVKGR